ncbi:alpha-2-macroglobulin [Brucepastera parasyntrophica]|uniref:Ig-like domain-containing alpha-2-macroglobulin family protein n=1 Tax=Brucepastera parasyntrophica TaxID=2880008 RepID=UPI00210958A0|nr:Ig-like domain-containing alpha-2-macroglobulin family protein [Brucepastera parasyntrophica]ULQ60112.1 alpha-2-macroglobulin [Brucepastera parasyntrophica]
MQVIYKDRFLGFSCAVLITALLAGLFLSCGNNSTAMRPDPKVVAAYTGGIVSQYEPIRVVFTKPHDKTTPVSQSAFRLNPQVPGTLSWENDYTLVFTPAKAFKPKTRYEAVITPASFSNSDAVPFSFGFATASAPFEVRFDPVKIDNPDGVRIAGTVFTDSGVNPSKVEKVINSRELGSPEWIHEGTTHRFTFSPVMRKNSIQTVAVKWDARAIDSQEKGEVSIQIPELKRFEVLEIYPEDNNTLLVTFSSPLRKDQDLRGFVSLSGNTNIRYSIEDNIARIYGTDSIPPGSVLSIQDLSDKYGETLYQPVQYSVPQKWELPEVRFTGSGNILPGTQGATMVLETRNLSGVIVEAFEIYDKNIIQFLQVNDIAGTKELYRVGEPVWVKSFDLPWSASKKNQWIRQGLDLSELSQKHPDSMFRIRVTFRKKHVQYECTVGHSGFSDLEFPGDTLPPYPANNSNSESSYWDYYSNSRYDYNWYRYRFDPCHPAFYMSYSDHDITIGKNVLVSDLGMLAKRSVSGDLLVAVTNLRTAMPAANADVELFAFQGRLIESLKTDKDGIASIKSSANPAFIFAGDGKNHAFLRMNDSLTLATSHFDISGDKASDGVKGVIYGDRGVWRPGDTIYLTFLLADTRNTLPPDHPVLFELEDPQGRIIENRTFTSSVNGFYPIPVTTKDSAPTGDWIARVRVGGNVFTKNLKIETVMPNRLKMVLDSGGKKYLDSSRTDMTLDVTWLHGAPAPSLKADISIIFADRETSFPSYTDYTFRDPSRSVSSERHVIFNGNLDEKGKAKFPVQLSPGTSVPGKLYARFLTRVFEPSGVFSSEQVSMDFSPYTRYVGIKLPKGDAARNMLLTDTDHKAEIVILDPDGVPVKGNVQVECAVYQMNWRWWWEKGGNESADFTNALSRTPVMKETVTVSNGGGSWNFRVNYPSWGRYLIIVRDTRGGHAAANIAYIDWPGWAGRAQEGQQGAAFMLNMTTEKQSYTTGEKVSVSFPSNKDARALAVIEKGGEIIRQEWVTCTDGTTKYEFPADFSMAPNVYVHITLLQQHLQTMNDLPIRLYGIIPVSVVAPETKLNPQIIAPKNWEPMTKSSFTVKEANGKPMTYTAVVVDEGLLGLTRYSMPNPWNTFYRREASFLKSWDMYSSVMGAYSGKLETLLAIGGGDDDMDSTVKKTDRFKPVVEYFGPYELRAGESRTEEFDMPQYVGAVRIMVVAADSSVQKQNSTAAPKKAAYGVAEQSVTVKSDLMILGTVPRTLSPNDEVVIPVSVFSYAEGARVVRVSIALDGSIAQVPGSANFAAVRFDKPGDKIVEFRVKAADIPGRARIRITATSKDLKDAVSDIELDVRSTVTPITTVVTKLLSSGSTWNESIALPGLPGTNTAVLELSRIPPLGLEKRLGFLISYPHGCIEQTTSSVFPQLFLDKVLTLTDDEISKTRTNIAAGIQRIATFQTYSGGLSYWPGNADPNEWGTSYAGHFLICAQQAGYTVPETLLNKWTEFQKNRAASWSGSDSQSILNQAYRLYTLALGGSADIGSMNRLRERGDLPNAAAWRLAAAYWYAGQRDAARSMIRNLTLTVSDYKELSGTFGSTFRDKAMILETLGIMGEEGKSKNLLEDVIATLSSEKWLSTQETAYGLISVIPFVQGSGDSRQITVDCSIQGNARTVSFNSPVIRVELGNISGNTAQLNISNKSAVPAYARIIAAGLPAEGSEPALREGLTLSVQYRDMDGDLINPSDLPLGEDMEVSVTVGNITTSPVQEVAVVHVFPASWELINTRLTEDSGKSNANSGFKYQDLRDDRIMTYFDLNRGESKTITFRVNQAYGGTYFFPAIHAYAMYDESIRALVPGRQANPK